MKKDLWLNFTGYGAAFNPEKENTSAWFSDNGIFYLIDSGETVFGHIWKEKAFREAKSIAVILTHMHCDHVGSIGTLVSYWTMVMGRTIEIYYPSERLEVFMDVVGIDRSMYTHVMEVPDEWSVRITPYPVVHASNMACFGYVIERAGYPTIYYSGDAADIPDDVLDRFRKKDIEYICHDTSMTHSSHHCYVGILEKKIAQEDRSRVYCMHLSEPGCENDLTRKGFRVVKIEPPL